MRCGRPAPNQCPRGATRHEWFSTGRLSHPWGRGYILEISGDGWGQAPRSRVGWGQQGTSGREMSWVCSPTGWPRGAGEQLFVKDPSLKWNFVLRRNRTYFFFFFCRLLMCNAFLFLFFGKQPLCKPREDYTLFCLELSQELFTFTEIRSCQPAGLTTSPHTPRPSALLLCPHGPILESTFPSLPRFDPPARAHLF